MEYGPDPDPYTMFDSSPISRTPWVRIAVSAVAHGALLFFLVHHGLSAAVRVRLPGTTLGTHIDLAYLPGRAPQPTFAANPRLKRVASAAVAVNRPIPTVELPPSPTALIAPALPQPAPAVQSGARADVSPSPAPSSMTGTDAQGEGNIQIALTTYAPDPEPDLSLLPRGTQGDVIVDVTIDPSGKVSDLQILHALGYGIEDAVAHTVRAWVFHPATRDGMPISSIQELHFHFARG